MKTREVKFTTDGKKVVVIGSLNSQEKIVQEIFIVDGSEIPSGEHFVVKSLHDAPAESWQSKDLAEKKKTYERLKKQYTDEIDSLKKQHEDAKIVFGRRAAYLRSIIDNIAVETFDYIVAFLKGDLNWCVTDAYTPTIEEFKDFRCSYDKSKLKLISLFGSDDGKMRLALHEYSDGSGGSKAFCYFYKTKEEAVAKLSELINGANRLSKDSIQLAKEYGITLNPIKYAEYKDNCIVVAKKEIAELEKKIEIHAQVLKNAEAL